MLPSLGFVPAQEVFDSFNNIMPDFPVSELNVVKYFEDTYLGKHFQIKVRVPQFSIRISNMYERVQGELLAQIMLSRMAQCLPNQHSLFSPNNL